MADPVKYTFRKDAAVAEGDLVLQQRFGGDITKYYAAIVKDRDRAAEMQKIKAALQETKEAWTEPTAERRMTLRSADARAERTPAETVELASPLHRLALEALSFRYLLSLLEADSPLLRIFEDVVPDLDNNANFTWGGANPEEYDAEEDDLAPRE